jgi:hypothetical protein
MRKLLVLLAAVAFVVAFTIPAMAADWSFYGHARMSTFMESDSKEVGTTGFDDDDLTWDLQSNARTGATVKAGAIGGGFEYGHTSTVNLRKLYGTWNFGGGTLLVGQTYTPLNIFQSNQVWAGDVDLLPYGGIYDGRRPMIQLSMAGFKIALVKPATATVTGFASVDTDTTLPKIEASYAFKAGPARLEVFLGYNTYDVVDATDKEVGVDSTFMGLAFNVGLGAAYINGNVYMGTNLGPFGMWEQGANDPTITGDQVNDNDSLGYVLVAGFKVSDTIGLEAGYGHQESELDVAGSKTDDTDVYYVNATINLAKGCFIVPEIGKVDYKDSAAGAKQGDTTYYGAKWQINF